MRIFSKKSSKPASRKVWQDQGAVQPGTTEQPWDTACREKAGWVSPSYTQSRTVRLDPFVAAANRCMAALPNSPYLDVYKSIRTQIIQKAERTGGKTIMVTSAVAGEGKTTCAVNLAFTFAREFSQTVLLVDCDLRRQRIHEFLGIRSDKGLANHLLNDEPISDLIVWPGFEKLTLISGGRTIQESTEVLGSPRMKEVVQDMKARYPDRYIFFDVPAVLASADALALAPQMDHILMVVEACCTPLSEVRRALELIPEEKIIGLVLNKCRDN